MFKHSRSRTNNTLDLDFILLYILTFSKKKKKNVVARKQGCCGKNICFSIYKAIENTVIRFSGHYSKNHLSSRKLLSVPIFFHC